MLMSKRVARVRDRVLILPLPHAAGVPCITPGSRRASAAWLLLDLLPKLVYFGVSWCIPVFPAWKPGLYLFCGLLQLTPKTSRLTRPAKQWLVPGCSHLCHCSCSHRHFCWQGWASAGAVPRAAPSRSQARAAVDADLFSAAALSSPNLSQSGTKYSSDLELCCKHSSR